MILVLGGTTEARILADDLHAAGIKGVLSLAGLTATPEQVALPMRVGGFGGEEGYLTYLREAGIRAVIDATHPFATFMSARSARLSALAEVPYLRLIRPAWSPVSSDRWTIVPTPAAVGAVVDQDATVFLATGPAHINDFACLADRKVYVRVINAETVLPFGNKIVGRPPFPVASEVSLFARLGITWLVTKNAGGPGRAKLEAARALGIKVAMIARPQLPRVETVETPRDALQWLQSTL